MSTAVASLVEMAAEWRTARRLFPFYSALIREFQLEVVHCADLENPLDRPEREVLERIHKWFCDVDQQVQVAQMRQLLQKQRFGEEETLRALLLHHLPQQHSDDNLRDKLDYLLVQYFAAVAPHHPHDEDVTPAEVRETLHPVLGSVEWKSFSWVKELDNIAAAVDRCSSLTELLDSGLVELGRKAKHALGEEYFKPAALIEVTRFNFRLRLGFFRLMHSDLHAIRRALQELEAGGVGTVDCREAGLGAEEPLATLRTLCHQWKKPFREAYRAGQSFRQLGIVRNVLQNAVMTHWAKTSKALEEGKMAAPKDPPLASDSTPQPSREREDSLFDNLEQVAEAISEQLFASKQKSTVLTVVLGESKEVLASWEVNAFVRGGDPACAALQRVVAARFLLAEAAGKQKAGRTSNLAGALETAHLQAASIQEHVAKAKDRGDVDAAVSLAASAKRLLALILETEKLRA